MEKDRRVQQVGTDRPRKRGQWAPWWRWGVSLAVFFFVLSWIDLGSFKASLARLQWGPLLLGFLLLITALVLFRGTRTWTFLRTQRTPISLGESLRIQWVGLFFGFLLPGTLGIDAWRLWAISRIGDRPEPAMTAVALDRVVGFMGLLVIICLAFFVIGGSVLTRHGGGIILDALLLSLAALAVFSLLSSRRIVDGLGRLPLLRGPRIRKLLTGLQDSLELLRRRPGRFLMALGISATGHLISTLAVFVLAEGLGARLAFGYYMAIVPFANIAVALPISFSGLGVRDLTYVSLFQSLGVSAETMLAVSVAEFGLTLFIRLLGGVFYALPGCVPSRT